MQDLIQGFLANLAIVIAGVALWANLRRSVGSFGGEQIVFGTTMGGIALTAMTMGFQIAPGIMLDVRVAPIAAAGFFGGPVAAGIAAGAALLFRLWLGGFGAPVGCVTIIAAAGAALVMRKHVGRRAVATRDMLLLAGCVAVLGHITVAVLGVKVASLNQIELALSSTLFNFAGVALAGGCIVEEQRRAALNEANALFRAIIDALPDCLNVKDTHGRFIAANPATARLMQAASSDELIGKTDFDFYPAATASRFRDEELAIEREQKEVAIDQKAEFADGRTVWLSTLKAPFRSVDGAITGLITHNRDITQTKLMQLELQTTKQQLADALANMADGLVLYDADARVVLCNEQYRVLFPMTADLRIVGAHLPDILRAAVARGEERLPPDLGLDTWITGVLTRIRAGGSRLVQLCDGRWIETRTRGVADGGSLTILSDITARKVLEQQLQHRAEHDPLTGLANRAAFEASLARMYRQASLQKGEFGIMLIDLDKFKEVNDTFGHLTGDDLLVAVARRLEAVTRHGDVVARLGGDEFAILGQGRSLEADLARLASRVLESLIQPLDIRDVTLRPGASIGFSAAQAERTTPEILLAQADEALYAAKFSGRRRWTSFRTIARQRMERDTATALAPSA